uniref:Putative S41 family peptidase n=1 Tax=termite gut metagenome TaxID=433724 RepID=S0DDL8_9ZZZZ
MKRLLQTIFAAAAVALLTVCAVSCKDTPVDKTKKLSLSKTSVTINAKGQTTEFTIVAKAAWTLTLSGSWITASPTSGTAESTVTVKLTATPNDGEAMRVSTVTISAAGESEPYIFTVNQSGVNTLTGINKWVYETLEKWYYWNDAVKAATLPSNSLAYDEFLNTLLLDLDGAQDDTENPPTIDGNYYANGDRYVYSYILQTSATRAASEETTFGFDIEPFYISKDDANRLGFLVKWVQPDGPADLAGIKRGMWIYQYAGANIYLSQYETFWYQLHYQQGGNTMTLTDDADNEYDLTAASMKVTPILYHDVITSDEGKKVAYLVYNQFERGEVVGRGDGEYDNDLRELFGEFKAAGATELVLDLRYNPGGYVSSCQILTSLSGAVGASDVFAKLLRNDDIREVYNVANPEVANFLDEPNSLGLDKIYVLETSYSASASEMVINALRGVLGDNAIVHIGTKTEGKNVGMDLLEQTVGAYDYEMWPITFKIMNAKDFCNYAGGLTPNYLKNEYWDIINTEGGVLREFGDPEERLLNAALTLIDGGQVVDDTSSRAAQTRAATGATEMKQPAKILNNPRQGGAKYIPNL